MMSAFFILLPVCNFIQERYPIIWKARLLSFQSAFFTTVCIVVFVFVVWGSLRDVTSRSVDMEGPPGEGHSANPHFWARSQICEKRLLASSYLSVRMVLGGSHLTDFHERRYFSMFRKPVEKIQVSLKPGKNNGYFTWRPVYIYDNISLISC